MRPHNVSKTKTVPSSPRRLLIVGVGHASLYLFRSIADWVAAGHGVTILNDHPFFYYSGMLPEYLGGVYEKADFRVDLEASCRRVGATLLLGKATNLQLQEKAVMVSEGRGVKCDIAVFDLGSVNPHADAAGGAIMTKPLHRLDVLEQSLREGDCGHLAIVGGGAAGVEIALNLSARYPDLALSVLEAGDGLLPEFPRAAGRIAERLLSERGIRIHTDVHVASVAGDRIHCDGATMTADVVLWATGTTGQPIFQRAGLPCDERGFVKVDRSLRCPSAPWLFAAGDCAVVEGLEELRRIGVHAVKQGPTLEANLTSVLGERDGELKSFRPYPVAPLILSTGSPKGIFTAGPFVVHSGLALRLKHWADLRWMRAFNRTLEVSGLDLVHARCAKGS